MQQPREKFLKFLTDAKKLTRSCEFESLKDQLIRDKLVMGINDLSLLERLLRLDSEELTLSKTVEHCRSAQASKQQIMQLHKITVSVQGNNIQADLLMAKSTENATD